jgi:hypothetical protein
LLAWLVGWLEISAVQIGLSNSSDATDINI